MLTPSHLRALAADIEDVLIHNELDDQDTETLQDVVAALLSEAGLEKEN